MSPGKTLSRSRYFGSAIVCAYLIGAYGLAVVTPLVWNEEYPCLVDPTKCALDQIGDLRPLYALVNFIFFSLSNFFGNLFAYRAFGFLGFVLLHLLIFKSLKRMNQGRDTSAILFATMIASSLPSFMTMAFSPNIAIYSWSTCLAILAVNANLEGRNTSAVLLTTTSILFYPPSTFFAFSYLFMLHLLRSQFRLTKFAFNFICFSIIVISSSLLSLLVSNLVLALTNSMPKDRVGLLKVEQIDDKLLFFLTRLIPVSVRGPLIGSPSVHEALLTTSIILFLLLFFIFAFCEMQIKPTLELTIGLSVAFVASLTPFLVARPTEIDFRIVRNSSWLIWFSLLFLGFKFLRERALSSVKAFANLKLLSLLLIMFSLAVVNWRYEVYFHQPFVEKNMFIRSVLVECERKFGTDRNIVVVSKLGDFPRYQNIGVFSLVTDLSQKWVPEPNVFLLAKENRGLYSYPTDLSRENCFVDFNLYAPTKWAEMILIKHKSSS